MNDNLEQLITAELVKLNTPSKESAAIIEHPAIMMDTLLSVSSLKLGDNKNITAILRAITGHFSMSVLSLYELLADEFLFEAINSEDFKFLEEIIEKNQLIFLKSRMKVLYIFKNDFKKLTFSIKENSKTIFDFLYIYQYSKMKGYEWVTKKFDAIIFDENAKVIFEPFDNFSDSVLKAKPGSKYEFQNIFFKNTLKLNNAINYKNNAITLLKEQKIKIFESLYQSASEEWFVVNKLYKFNSFWKTNTHESFRPMLMHFTKYNPNKHIEIVKKILREAFDEIDECVDWYKWFNNLNFENKILWFINDRHIQIHIFERFFLKQNLKSTKEIYDSIKTDENNFPDMKSIKFYLYLRLAQEASRKNLIEIIINLYFVKTTEMTNEKKT